MQNTANMTSRRNFLKHSSILMGTAGLAPYTYVRNFDQKSIAPSDQIRYGVIGCNGMGWSNMRSHLQMGQVECVALCDVDQSVLDKRSQDVFDLRGKKPKQYKDYRALLDQSDIDAVVIGTPDHWHCKMMLDTLASGKHVYVEKPLANSIGECNAMLTAAQASNKMVQVGQWQRSGTHYRHAIDFLHTGKLGNIRLVKTWAYQGWMKPVDVVADGSVPDGVDYDMWLGPAKKRPFNKNRFHFNFRWFWDYAGGLMTDWGVHEIDIALFAMNVVAPKSVMASGGKLAYPDDASETPDTLQTVFEYDNFNMLWEHATGIDGGNYGKTEGIAFIGNNGTLVLNRGGWEIIPEKHRVDEILEYKMEALPYQNRQSNYLDLHTKNFVEAMEKNDKSILRCGIESGSVAAINAHMGNVAFKTQSKVFWDKKSGKFKTPASNALIMSDYHNGWKL